MPWSGSAPSQTASRTDGTRTGDTTWNQADAAGVKIVTSGHDSHDTDLKDMINATLKKDGGNTATANIPMGGFTLTNIASATARTSPASFAQAQDNAGQYIATVGGTADVITLTPSPAITAYAAGQRFQFIASGTNTGAVTVNVSGVGAKAISNRDAAFTALAAGNIVGTVLQDIEYDGTRFQLVSPAAGGIADNSVSTAKIVDDAVTYAKIQNVSATARVLGRKTAAAGDTEECTLSEVLDFVGSATTGDILVRGAATWARLAAGTATHLLTANGAGVLPSYQASTSIAAATQAEQEAGASTTVAVTPGRQHFHPSAAKAWLRFNSAGTVAASYNITSVTDTGGGNWTVNIATDFSTGAYCGVAFGGGSTDHGASALSAYYLRTGAGAGTFNIGMMEITTANTVAAKDPLLVDEIYATFFGDHV